MNTQEQTSKLAYSVDEVGEMLSLSPWTVRKMIYNKELPSIKIGRSVRILATDLHAYVENQRCNQPGVNDD